MFRTTERQSTQMSKITNDGLTLSGTRGCFIAVPIWQQWVLKGYQIRLRRSVLFFSNRDMNSSNVSCKLLTGSVAVGAGVC